MRRRALPAASQMGGGGNGLEFPITLVEGENGQVGIDVFNYLFAKAYTTDELSYAITEELYFKGTSYSAFDGRIVSANIRGENALMLWLQNNHNAANLIATSDGVVRLNIYG